MVEIYSTNHCPACKAAKSYMTIQGIPYVEKNVENSEEYLNEMLGGTGAMSVPQMRINGEWLVGFNKMKFDSLVNKNEEDDFLSNSEAYSGEIQICTSCEG